MKVLDGDDVRLSAKGRYAERDIVQVGCVCVCCYESSGKESDSIHCLGTCSLSTLAWDLRL